MSPAETSTPRPPVERTWLRLVIVVGVAAALFALAALWDPRTGSGRDVDPRNGQAFIQDNLWTAGDAQYAVWVGDDAQPLLGVRAAAGGWETTDLGAVGGNPLAAPTDDDTHNVYVLAVDPLGHVHVAGNMHTDQLRYIRTERPGRYDRWVTPAMGGENQSVTYPAFVALPDGTLLFFRREGLPGRGQLVLDRLPSGDTEWQHVGVIVDGIPSSEGPYFQHVAVDPDTGSIHLAWLWRQGPTSAGNNDVSYMRSDDRGASWTRSDGTPIELPAVHDTAELVLDTGSRSGLLNNGGMIVDADGRPHMVLQRGDRIIHLRFDGEGWIESEPIAAFTRSRPSLARGPDGTVWAIGIRGTQLAAEQIHPDVGPTVRGSSVARGWEPTPDTQAMQLDDRIDILIALRHVDEPLVETLDLTG